MLESSIKQKMSVGVKLAEGIIFNEANLCLT